MNAVKTTHRRGQILVGSVRFELTNSYAPGTNLTKLDHDPEPNTRHSLHSKKVTRSYFDCFSCSANLRPCSFFAKSRSSGFEIKSIAINARAVAAFIMTSCASSVAVIDAPSGLWRVTLPMFTYALRAGIA